MSITRSNTLFHQAEETSFANANPLARAILCDFCDGVRILLLNPSDTNQPVAKQAQIAEKTQLLLASYIQKLQVIYRKLPGCETKNLLDNPLMLAILLTDPTTNQFSQRNEMLAELMQHRDALATYCQLHGLDFPTDEQLAALEQNHKLAAGYSIAAYQLLS